MTNSTLSPLIAPSSSGASFLVVESGGLAGQKFPLPGPPGVLLLGRERLCNVRFDPERDRVVGRTHARLEVRPDGIYLVDLNSANGTFRADGAAVRGETRLHFGDRFQLGGEGGPWLMLQGVAPREAVHIAPPMADTPTLITKLSDLPLAAPSRDPQPLAASLPDPPRPLPVAPQLPGTPLVPKVPEPAPRLAREQPVRTEPIAADPLAQQHHGQYQRQVALIALLLVLTCSLGLAIGLSDGTGEDEAATTHVE